MEVTADEKSGAVVSGGVNVELFVTEEVLNRKASLPAASWIAFVSFPEVGSV